MKVTFPTLYKRGRNSILVWTIKVEEKNNSASLMMTAGIIDKGQTITWQHNIKGKNKGKANETTSVEQAYLEAESKIRLKEKMGYISLADMDYTNGEVLSTKEYLDMFLPRFNLDDNGNEIPMKCQQYYRSKKNWIGPDGVTYDDRKTYYMLNPSVPKPTEAIIIDFPCYVQPKVNGVRAFLKQVPNGIKIYSKKGLEYKMPHIEEFFLNNPILFDMYEEDVIYDGELYIEGALLQDISSATKVYTMESMSIKFHIFDIAIPDMNQKERFAKLYSPASKHILTTPDAPVTLVSTKVVQDDIRVQMLTDEYITQGYEGSICRDMKGMYEFGGRPKTITKLKRMMDEEFEIVDVVGSDKDPNIGLFVCVTKDGVEFKVNPKGTTEFKRQVMTNHSSFIGKQLTCWFYEYTEAGKPFHITNNVVRDYE